MNAGMFSSQFCHSPPSPWRNSSGGPSPPLSITLIRRPRISSDRVIPGQSTVVQRRVVAVGVRGVRSGPHEHVAGKRAYLPDEPRHAATVPAAVRLAIDIDSTLHPYWDQLAEIARRRFGIDLPYDLQVTWDDRRARARSSCRPASRRPTARSTCSPPSRTRAPSRRSARGTSRATSSTSRPTAPPTRTPHTERVAATQIGLPHDELYCSYDKIARCVEIGIDVLIDDSPVNLAARRRGRDHRRDASSTRGTATWPASSAPRTGRRWPRASSRCSHERRAATAPRPARPPRVPAGGRARAPDHRLGPLRARRVARSTRRSTSSSTTTGSGSRSRGSSTSRPRAARCWSPTTPARCRPTRR